MKELVKHVQSKLGDDSTTDEVVAQVFASITELVMQGETVSVRNFGKFEAPVKAAHDARNPKTGETIRVPERRRPRLKVSANFGK